MPEDDIEDIREAKKEELQQRQQEQQEQARKQAEAQMKQLLRQTLTAEARERLNNIEMAKPQFAEQVKKQLVALARSGRVQGKIDDDQMKGILQELQDGGTDYDIKRR
jgi:programmed cell death protein 5